MKMKSPNLNMALASVMLALASLASSNALASPAKIEAALAQVPCLGNICLGSEVQIIGNGDTGTVISIDSYNQIITVLNRSNYQVNVYARDLRLLGYGQGQNSCAGNVCVGDQVRVLNGPYIRSIGYVVATNNYSYTVTVDVGGRYTTLSARDVNVLSQSPRPYPQPAPRPLPPPPRPMPQPPRPYPQPMPPSPAPMPPRPAPMPPRGPQGPGRVEPPRGPQGPSRPGPGQQGPGRPDRGGRPGRG